MYFVIVGMELAMATGHAPPVPTWPRRPFVAWPRGVMTDHARMSLLILAVKDLGRSARFYRDAFEWPQEVDVPVYAEFRLPCGLRLGLYERQAFGVNTGIVPFEPPAGAVAPVELYFHPDDLDACRVSLERAGARTLSALAPRAWGDEAMYFADPDGNVLVIARRVVARRVSTRATPSS